MFTFSPASELSGRFFRALRAESGDPPLRKSQPTIHKPVVAHIACSFIAVAQSVKLTLVVLESRRKRRARMGSTPIREPLEVQAPRLLEEDRMAMKAVSNAAVPRTAFFKSPVRDFMRPRNELVIVKPGTPCAELISQLTSKRSPCGLVVDNAGRPIGILTEQDIARRIAYRTPPDTPVEKVMTEPVLTVQRRQPLYQAIAALLRHDFQQMPVVDRQGGLVGVLHLRDVQTVASYGLMRQIERLSHEETIEGLKEVKVAQAELAEALFADNVPATEVQQLLTSINNDIYRRIGEMALKQMTAEGWGDLPANAATIVMGSGGRGENFLFPDQDNGFIIADYPDSEHTRIDAYFIELAERLCRILNEVGFPYCKGHCMAMNPLWRKTLSQWIEQINLWGHKSNFVAIRLSDIFFDFQPVWGNSELAHELRRVVTRLIRKNPFFLKQMFLEKARHNVALGFLGGFVTEKANSDYRGQIDLKYTGTVPLVGAIRLLALREGVEQTPTLERIRVLKETNVLGASEQEDLSAAFSLLTEVLLKKQLADFNAGRPINYYVDPKTLSKRQRWLLLDAFRSINTLRERVYYEFTAQLF
jgi:signal-transduction protein with cAMP-binding, CBS, and nucleotidyltransferase domain